MDKSHERSNSSNSTFGSEQEAALQKLVVTFQDLIGVLGGLGGNHHAIRVEDAVGLPDVQQAGADAFSLFEKVSLYLTALTVLLKNYRRAKHLDKELTSFVNATRTLGGSAGIRAASVVLRGRLDQILLLFHKNARNLFPNRVPPVPQEGPAPRLKGDIVLQNAKSQGVGKVANVGDSNAENWPEQLEQFAADVDHLLSYVDDFSTEFIDEAVSDTSLPLVTDLKYWASCLKIYKGKSRRFESPEIQTYLHELTEELGRHLENIAISLSTFIEVGIPSIRYAQKHGNKTLLHLSTVATFFSAVTATTLQYSYAQTPVTTLSNLVNGFWFSSLLLSSGAALNTWLVLTWKDAHYRSPRHQLPVWVSFWITHSPPVFLILSSMCFLIGLILFVYSSPGQARGTHIAATFVFACSCLGLCVISIWFAAERWIFSHYKGVKRLSEVLADSPGLIRLPLAISSWFFQEIHRATYKMAEWSVKMGNEVMQAINAAIAGARERRQARETSRADVESRPVPIREPESPTRIPSTITPLAAIPELGPAQTPGTNSSEKYDEGRPTHTTQAIPLHKRLVNRLRSAPSEVAAPPDLPHAQDPSTRSSRRTGSSPTSMENLIRSMIVYGRAQAESISASNGVGVPPPKRKGTGSTEGSRPHSTDFTTVPTLHHGTFTYLLKRLEATQNLRSHQALVSHLQFSPDGKFLATSSWDSTVRILGVGMPYRSVHILAHPKRLVTKVVWSPDGEMLLTMVARGINIWTKDGVRKNTITRRNDVKSISWMPNSKAFLSVEEREVVMFDLGGTAMHTYKLDRVSVQDVAVTTDGERMLCVGALTASPDGFKPKSSQVEKQIIVFNFEKKETESRVPVLNEVRDVKLARHARDQLALVSYKNKAQLWKLNIDPERKTAQPTLRHTYISKLLAELAGACQFGGRHDEFVLGASEGGLIYIWDRDDGALLHSFVGKGQTMERDIVMSCIAWNHVADPFTFATGCSDGVVKIWAAKDKKAPNDPWSEALPFFDINLLSDTPYENDEHPLAFPGIA